MQATDPQARAGAARQARLEAAEVRPQDLIDFVVRECRLLDARRYD